MSDTNIILTATGFIFHKSPYYVVPELADSAVDDLLSRTQFKEQDNLTTELFRSKPIYIAPSLNKALEDYNRTPNTDTFMTLVTLACEVLSATDVETFLRWQSGNPHITPTSIMFLTDVLSGNFLKTFRSYQVVPSSSRFMTHNGITETKARALLTKFTSTERINSSDVACGGWGSSEIYSKPCHDWVNILADIVGDKKAFEAFFKYLFVYKLN